MTNSRPAKRVLFLALSGIGNFLMQLPTIAVLKQAHLNWQITVWVAPRGTKALAENDPHIHEVIEASIKNTIINHLKMIKRLRQEHFDVGIVLSPGQLLKSAAYLFLAGIGQRIGNSYPLGSHQASSFLLTDAIDEDSAIHDVQQNLRLLQPLGIAHGEMNSPIYRLDIPLSNQQMAGTLLQELAIPAEKQLIGLHPGAAPGFDWKRWPLENFTAVAKELVTKHNAYILVFGGPDEAGLKEKLQQMIGKNATVISSDLLTTAAVMQHCKLFLSNDSGLMHLAAAVDVPTFGLFGPTDERHTGPRLRQGSGGQIRRGVIRAPGTKPEYNTEANFHLGQEPHPTMVAITPQLVADKILHELGQ